MLTEHAHGAQSHEAEHSHVHSGHDHGHVHVHTPKDFGNAFLIGIVLDAGFVAAEVVYGILGHSLALLADAGHNLSDVLGLLASCVGSERLG